MELTYPTDINYCINLSHEINKDYPNSARVEATGGKFVVTISDEYWNYCQEYVKENCKIKDVD